MRHQATTMKLSEISLPDTARSTSHIDARGIGPSSRKAFPWQEILNGVGEVNALVAIDGTILFANRSWIRANKVRGLDIGDNLVAYLSRRAASGNQDASALLGAWAQIASGERSEFKHRYAERDRGNAGDAEVRFFTIANPGERLVVATGSNLTELAQLRRKRQQLGSEVLEAQASERRRIARELHDSTSQFLVTLQLDLSLLRNCAGFTPKWLALVDECRTALDLAQKEIRTLSYVYHPPSLEGRGLVAAMKTLVDGFASRTGLSVHFDADGTVLDAPLAEMTLYRLAQEALANIHRHAETTDVGVYLAITAKYAHLVIYDDGLGLAAAYHDAPIQVGVGIAGMRERVREIGGRVSLRFSQSVTRLIASVPKEPRI